MRVPWWSAAVNCKRDLRNAILATGSLNQDLRSAIARNEAEKVHKALAEGARKAGLEF